MLKKPDRRAEIVELLRRNPPRPASRLFWTVADQDRFDAMVRAGKWNREYPDAAITPADLA